MVIVTTNCMAKYILQDEDEGNLSNEQNFNVRSLKYAAQNEANRDLWDKPLSSLRALKSALIKKRSSCQDISVSSGFTGGFADGYVYGDGSVVVNGVSDYIASVEIDGVDYVPRGVCYCNVDGVTYYVPQCADGSNQKKCPDGSSGRVAKDVYHISVFVCPKQ
jgi:hypothetical protein